MDIIIKQLEARVAELEASVLAFEETFKIFGRQLTREQIWFEAWKIVAERSGCRDAKTATGWADDCLRTYDAKFGKGVK